MSGRYINGQNGKIHTVGVVADLHGAARLHNAHSFRGLAGGALERSIITHTHQYPASRGCCLAIAGSSRRSSEDVLGGSLQTARGFAPVHPGA